MALDPVTIQVKIDPQSLTQPLQQFARDLERTLKQSLTDAFKDAFKNTGDIQKLSAEVKKLANELKSIDATAQKANDQINSVSKSSDKLAQSTRKASQSQKELKKSTDEATEAQKKAKEEQDALNKLRAVATANALKAGTAEQRFAAQLLRSAALAGRTADEIAGLAKDTGLFNQEQVKLARETGDLIVEFTQLKKAIDLAEQSEEELSDTTQELVRRKEKLVREIRKQREAEKGAAQEIRKQAKEMRDLERATKRREQAVAQLFAQSLEARTAEQKFTIELLKQNAAAGNNVQALERIAQASNLFTSANLKSASTIATLSARQKELSATIDRTAREERELIAITRQLAKEQANLSRSTKTAQEAQGALVKGFGRLQVGFAKLNNTMAAVRNVITIVDQTLVALFRTAREGTAIQQTADSFQNLAENVIGIPDLLDRLSVSANGTVSQLDLMRSTLTLVSGLPGELANTFSQALASGGEFGAGLIEISRAAQILNPGLGDTQFFIESLAAGIKRGERRLIDNLGILVSARVAYERYSQRVGKTVLELDELDKQQAILNETLRVGNLLVGQVGDSVNSNVDAYDRLSVQIKEITDDIKVLIGEALLPLVQVLSGTATEGFLGGLNEEFKEVAESTDDARVQLEKLLEIQRRAKRTDLEQEGFRDIARGVSQRAFENRELLSPGIVAGGISGLISQLIRERIESDIREATAQETFEVGLQLAIEEGEIDEILSLLTQSFLEAERLPIARSALASILRESEGRGIDPFTRGEELGLVPGTVFALLSDQELGDQGIQEVVDAYIRLKFAELQAKQATEELTESVKTQAEVYEELRGKLKDLNAEQLPKLLKLTSDVFKATDEESRLKALDKLNEGFVELAKLDLSKEGIGKSIDFIRDFEVALGTMTVAEKVALEQTEELSQDMAELFTLVGTSGTNDPLRAADAFDILRLGLSDTAEEAFFLAGQTNFVQTTLKEARLETGEFGDEAVETAEKLEKFRETVDNLRESLANISASGFQNATSAIKDIADATERLERFEPKFGDVLVKFANKEEREDFEERLEEFEEAGDRLKEVNDALFGDIGEDTAETLEEQIKEIRESGNDITREYANLLEELGRDLSRSQRDSLIQEKFELEDLIFGGAPTATPRIVRGLISGNVEEFKEAEEDLVEASEALAEARRQTISDLFEERGELTFKQQVNLDLALGLVTGFEADLLIKERQIFDAFDRIFGDKSLIELTSGDVIDFGGVILEGLGSEGVANLVKDIEQAVADELGKEVLGAEELILELGIRGTIDTADIGATIAEAVSQIRKGASAQEAIAIQFVTEFTDITEVEEARAEVERLSATQGRVQVNLKELQLAEDSVTSTVDTVARFKTLGDAIPSTLLDNLKKFDDALSTVQELETEITNIQEDSEIQLEVFADISGAQAAIDNLLDGIPDEVTVKINADVKGTNIPQQSAGTGGSRPPTAQEFQTGGFTGNTPTNKPAGIVHGQEFVINAPSVDRLGIPNLELLQAGQATIIPNSLINTPDLNALITTAMNPIPSIFPAVTNNNVSNINDSSSVNRSVTNNNFFFNEEIEDVQPQRDIFG